MIFIEVLLWVAIALILISGGALAYSDAGSKRLDTLISLIFLGWGLIVGMLSAVILFFAKLIQLVGVL